jgi:cytidine deaminase
MIEKNDLELIERARAVIDKSFDGVYHVVGAALRCRNGNIYVGVNCDGIHGSCAEFTAVGAAISAGEREFDAICAVYGHGDNWRCVAPCGNCRQMLFEYMPDVRVIIDTDTVKTARELLPYAYEEPVDLRKK